MTTNVFENEILTVLRRSFRNLIEAIDLDMILDMEECSLDFRLWPENELLETYRYESDNTSRHALDTVVKELLSSRRVVQTLLSYALDPPPPNYSPQDNRVKKYPKVSVQILVSLPCVLSVLAGDDELLASFFSRLIGGQDIVSEAASYSSIGNGTASDEASSDSSIVSPKLRRTRSRSFTKDFDSTCTHNKQLFHPPWFDPETESHFNKILEALLEYQKGVFLISFVRQYAFSRLPNCEEYDENYPSLLHALIRGIHLSTVTELLLRVISTGIPLRLFSYSYAGMEAYEDEREASSLDEDSTWSRACLRFSFEQNEEEVENEVALSLDSDVEEGTRKRLAMQRRHTPDNCIRLVRILLHRLYNALTQEHCATAEENAKTNSPERGGNFSVDRIEPGDPVEVVRSIGRVLSRLAVMNLRVNDELDSVETLNNDTKALSISKTEPNASFYRKAHEAFPLDIHSKPAIDSLERLSEHRKLEPEAHVIMEHMLNMLLKAYERLFAETNDGEQVELELVGSCSKLLSGVHFLFGAATKVIAAYLDTRVELNNWGEPPPLLSVMLKYVPFGVKMLRVAPKQPLLKIASHDDELVSKDNKYSSFSQFPLLGLHRLQMVKFFTALVSVPHVDVQNTLVQHEVLVPIIQLFFQYPNHNILHTDVERLIVAILRGNTAYELRMHLLDVIIPRIYQVAVDRREGKINPSVSNIGHVKRLAEELIAASAIQPSLCQMLKKNSLWSAFMGANFSSFPSPNEETSWHVLKEG
eukprot:jgi/Galph1/1924/GphlegSOOS_G615.1